MKIKKLNKFFYLIIALTFIFNSFVYLFLFVPAKTLIKMFVQQAIEKKEIESEEMTILAFNTNDLKYNKCEFVWVTIHKEFRFNGKMYDVEKSEVKGDSIYFTCYYDHEEIILEEIFVLFFHNCKKDKTNNYPIRLTFLGLYSEEIQNIRTLQNDSNANIPLPKKEDGILAPYKDVLTPPPRIIS